MLNTEFPKIINTDYPREVKEIIDFFQLDPHPEGGFFKETYRCSETYNRPNKDQKDFGKRACSTAIYFLLPAGSKSYFHRIQSDEIWHFYLGGAMTLVQISKDGEFKNIILGQDIKNGQLLQYVVPANSWFAAHPNEGTNFSLVGCTVAPGFDFQDFEMGSREELCRLYPNLKSIIEKLTFE